MTREEFKEQFGAYLIEKGITKFGPLEVCNVGIKHEKGAVLRAPQRTQWSNIIPTLKCAEQIRGIMREDYPTAVVRIHPHGGFRDVDFNKACGGASNSMHMRFNATDIEVWHKPNGEWVEISPKEVYAIATKLPLANRMGIGRYQGFTHIDTRGLIGMKAPARW